jgi:hypothetical protein
MFAVTGIVPSEAYKKVLIVSRSISFVHSSYVVLLPHIPLQVRLPSLDIWHHAIMVHCRLVAFLGACIPLQAIASPALDVDGLIAPRAVESHPEVAQNDIDNARQPLLVDATEASIDEARMVVQDAIARMTKLNKARLDNPIRGSYKSRPGTNITRSGSEYSPLLEITKEIAHAAALIAEADMAANLANGTSTLAQQAAGSFWMQDIRRQGTVPWGNDPTYKVRKTPCGEEKSRSGKERKLELSLAGGARAPRFRS